MDDEIFLWGDEISEFCPELCEVFEEGDILPVMGKRAFWLEEEDRPRAFPGAGHHRREVDRTLGGAEVEGLPAKMIFFSSGDDSAISRSRHSRCRGDDFLYLRRVLHLEAAAEPPDDKYFF
ncbi:hypothetical protein AVEN_188784-1 [Araneus ventricosus]|uniref:Uncharacterized protein n=1 Tax=Araneus ventricosus TaxID=182803 RepID=A0A4Y2IDS4_ARAVE|nr:hypothetical protein AVEN_188784-1 [Araneus ventricosus]